MKKKILLLLILVTTLFPVMVYASKKNEVLVGVNDSLVDFNDMKGKYINNTIYVPLREFAQALGITVVWDEQTQRINLNKNDKQIYLDVESKCLIEEGKENIPYEMLNEDGMTLIPARTIAEYYNYQVKYISKERVLRVLDHSATLDDIAFNHKYQNDICKHNAKIVYITFDDGPNDHTLNILDLLDQYDMKATFFMLDNRMKARPEIVEKIIEKGHAVGLHGVSHEKDIFYNGRSTPLNEMNIANATLEAITGKRSALVRMPYGSVPYLTNGQYHLLIDYGYRIWDWHLDSRDWASKDPNVSYESIVQQLKTTEEEAPVLLFHDRKTTVMVLQKVLAWMDSNGYTSECITKSMKPKTFKKIK